MGKKDNFNEAVYSMFGVGKAPTEAEAAEEVKEETAEVIVKETPVVAVTEEPKKEEVLPLTRIAEGTSMEGKLVAKGDVEIEGDFKGDVEAKGKVTICNDYYGNVTAAALCIKNCTITGDVTIAGSMTLSEQSMVIGNVSANEFVCCGRVKGDLDIQDNLTLKEKAQIEGNIAMGTLMVEQGAVIEGSISSKKKA